MPKQKISKTNKIMTKRLTAKLAKKDLRVSVVTQQSPIGANFDSGHLSKMSSLIKVSDMFVDGSYQRLPLKSKINRITKNFNPDLLGVIVCSMRDDNTLAIIDGSHRYHSLIAMGMNDSNVNAIVYFGLTIEDEAHIFAQTNKEHTKPTPAQIFKAGVVSKDKASVAINSIVEKIGASIHFAPGANNIRCVETIKKVYDNTDTGVLEKTLQTLKDAYPNNVDMFSGQMISAIACIYNRYGTQVNQKRLVDSLIKIGNPSIVLSKAKAMMGNGKVITFTSLPYLIVSTYNTRLTSNRLSDFPLNLIAQQVWTQRG